MYLLFVIVFCYLINIVYTLHRFIRTCKYILRIISKLYFICMPSILDFSLLINEQLGLLDSAVKVIKHWKLHRKVIFLNFLKNVRNYIQPE